MTNNIKDLESKIRKYHSLAEAIIIDYKPIGYPFYILNLDLTYLANRDLELLEEFVMKCIYNGLVKLREISGFLGININSIEKVLSGLISKDLITKEEYFKLTQEGKDALLQQVVLATESDSRTFYLDALNGKLTDNFYFSKFDTKRDQNSCIKKIIKKPRKDHIEDIIDYYESIEKCLQKPNSNNSTIELIQVNKIEKVYLEWHEILLVLYRSNSNDTEIEYEIFSKGSIQKDYRETIEKLRAEGKSILAPIFTEMKQNDLINESFNEILLGINDEDVKNVEKIKTKISSLNEPEYFIETQSKSTKQEKQKLEQELEQIKTQTKISEVIHTYEIREYLLRALKEAKKRIMIISPWIKSNVVNQEFISNLETALKHKVEVYIIYGIKGSSFQNDNWSIKQLENLKNKYKHLTFEKTTNSHRKQIVCDDKFAVVTSFNFLSFRADPNLTYRDELGVILRDQQTIEDLFNSGIELIYSAEKDI
jgi:molybdopterin converting factor small subunit